MKTEIKQKFNVTDIVRHKHDYDGKYSFYEIIKIEKIFSSFRRKYEFMYEMKNIITDEISWGSEENLIPIPEYKDTLKYNL